MNRRVYFERITINLIYRTEIYIKTARIIESYLIENTLSSFALFNRATLMTIDFYKMISIRKPFDINKKSLIITVLKN